MKKGVLFIIVLLSLSFISAGVCTFEGQGAHGVEIGGECFDCGPLDGICPEDFGVEDCTADGGVEDLDCIGPVVPAYFWSEDGVTQIDTLFVNMDVGKEIKVVGTNTGLSDGNISVEIYENDPWPNGDENPGIINGTVTSGKLIGTYSITDDMHITGGDAEGDGVYELYFIVGGDPDKRSNNLETTFDYIGEGEIDSCGDYSESDCNTDPEGVGNNTVITPIEDPDGSECWYDVWGECSWSAGECIQLLHEESDPDNSATCRGARETCAYSEGLPIGDCDAGDDFYQIPYTSGDEGCEDWTSNPIPCPQKLRVPFFGFYSFIISALMIGLIYVFLKKKNL